MQKVEKTKAFSLLFYFKHIIITLILFIKINDSTEIRKLF